MSLPVSYARLQITRSQSVMPATMSFFFFVTVTFCVLFSSSQLIRLKIRFQIFPKMTLKAIGLLVESSFLWVILDGMMLLLMLAHVKIFVLSTWFNVGLILVFKGFIFTCDADMFPFPSWSRQLDLIQGLITVVSAVPNGHRQLGAPCRAVFLSVSSGTPGFTCPLAITNDLQRATH